MNPKAHKELRRLARMTPEERLAEYVERRTTFLAKMSKPRPFEKIAEEKSRLYGDE